MKTAVGVIITGILMSGCTYTDSNNKASPNMFSSYASGFQNTPTTTTTGVSSTLDNVSVIDSSDVITDSTTSTNVTEVTP